VLYAVEIRRERASMTEAMSDIREWLDARRFEPDAFRYNTDLKAVRLRLDFSTEREAIACANDFGGRLISIGESPA